jgi:hypothetical protein
MQIKATISQIFQSFGELFKFIEHNPHIGRSLSIVSFPFAYMFFQDSLVINEELLIVLCFMTAIFFLYIQTGDSIAESLNERSDKIKTDLISFDVIKLDHLNNLYESTSRALIIKDQINQLREFSVLSIESLDANQKQAFVGLISKGIIEKLQILTNLNHGLFGNFLLESFTVRISRKLHLSRKKR